MTNNFMKLIEKEMHLEAMMDVLMNTRIENIKKIAVWLSKALPKHETACLFAECFNVGMNAIDDHIAHKAREMSLMLNDMIGYKDAQIYLSLGMYNKAFNDIHKMLGAESIEDVIKQYTDSMNDLEWVFAD